MIREIEVDHVPPVADLIAEGAIGFMIEIFWINLRKQRIRARMMIYDVNDYLHAFAVDRVAEGLEIIECAELRIDGTIVRDCIRRAKTSLTILFTDRLNRHEPDNIGAESLDARQILLDGAEGAGFTVISDKNRIDDLLTKT